MLELLRWLNHRPPANRTVPTAAREFAARLAGALSRAAHSYCVCQLPYDGSAMLRCDGCGEWYHLACIGVSAARAAATPQFTCHACAQSNGTGTRACAHDNTRAGVELAVRRRKRCVQCEERARPHSRFCSDECGCAYAGARFKKERRVATAARRERVKSVRRDARSDWSLQRTAPGTAATKGSRVAAVSGSGR